MKQKQLGRITKTNRGFEIMDFRDHYEKYCSLQVSSLALYTQPGTSALILGCDEATIKKFNKKNLKWEPSYLPSLYAIDDMRMCLTYDQIRKLIVCLQSWVDTGHLGSH